MGARLMRDVIDPTDCDRCVVANCGDPRDHLHHIDGDRSNNSPKNLLPVCSDCQNGIHNGTAPRYLPWYCLLAPSSRAEVPRVGRRAESDKQYNARVIDQRLKTAYDTAMDAAAATAPDPDAKDIDVALKADGNSTFVSRFKLRPISKKWADREYEHRARPIRVEKTRRTYVLQLPEADALTLPETRTAYETFRDNVLQDSEGGLGRFVQPNGRRLTHPV